MQVAGTYIIVDTNVVLHQIDFLEHSKSMSHVIILQTVVVVAVAEENWIYGDKTKHSGNF